MKEIDINSFRKDLEENKLNNSEITRKYGISVPEYYELIEEYNNDPMNNFKIKFVNGQRVLIPKKENEIKNDLSLHAKNTFRARPDLFEYLGTIKKWCEEHGRLPRNIKVLKEQKGEELTKEDELEYEYYSALNNYRNFNHITADINVDLDDIEDERNRECMKLFLEIMGSFSASKKYRIPREAAKLRQWCKRTGFKPDKSLKNANEDQELSPEEIEELQMYDILRTLRSIKQIEQIKGLSKEEFIYIIDTVKIAKNLYCRTDEAFINDLRQTLNNDSINIAPTEAEILRDILKGANYSAIIKEYGIIINELYRIIEDFCSKYNCCLIANKESKVMGTKQFVLKGMGKDIKQGGR